jgi:hypothetical protein
MRPGSTIITILSLAVGLYLLAPMLTLAIRGYLEVASQLAGR